MPLLSQRQIVWLVGFVASVVALVCLLGGAFHGVDAALFHWLGQGGVTSRLSLWIAILCVLLFAFGTTFVQMEVTDPRVRWGLTAMAFLQPISATAAGVLAGCRVSPFAWLLAILVPVAAAIAYRRSAAGRRERLWRTVFSGNVSPLTLATLLAQPELPPQATGTVLNARLLTSKSGETDAVAERLREAGAWVELQAGERVVAVWNVLLPVAAAAKVATSATLPLTGNWHVGVATGPISGELSAGKSWQMRGSAFERAAALCQANTAFGSRVLVDLATADAVSESILLRPVDLFAEPGASLGSEVYEPLALRSSAAPALVAERDAFWKAVIFFRQHRFSEALGAFRQAGDDPVVRRYLERLETSLSAS